MKPKAINYKDDGKAETRLNFDDKLAFVVSCPVTVRIDGEVPPEEAGVLEAARKAFEERVTRAIDVALFGICLAAFAAVDAGEAQEVAG